MRKEMEYIKHIYCDQKVLPLDAFDIPLCISIYEKYKNGFFSRKQGERFTHEQLAFYCDMIASFTVGGCFYYGREHKDSARITVPSRREIKKGQYIVYWDKVYPYGKIKDLS